MADDPGGADELLGALVHGDVVLTKTHLDAAAGQHPLKRGARSVAFTSFSHCCDFGHFGVIFTYDL